MTNEHTPYEELARERRGSEEYRQVVEHRRRGVASVRRLRSRPRWSGAGCAIRKREP
jgi:hypothetical protein